MSDRAYFQRIAADIAVLYELSLAVGRSLDVTANCEAFLSVLMRRHNLGHAAVWLRRPGAPPAVADREPLGLAYANPRVYVDEERLPRDHALVRRATAEGAFSFALPAPEDPAAEGLVPERGLRSGVYTVYPLGNAGLLTLVSLARRAPLDREELQQLQGVVTQFAVSLEGCLAHAALAREVTERQHAEADLRASEERLSAILTHAPACIYAKDAHGRYVFVNDPMTRLLGLPAEQCIDRTDFDLFAPPIAAGLRETDQAVLRSGQPAELEETLLLADGEHTYLTTKFPITDVGGAPAVCGVSIEITERRRGEDERRRLERQMQRAQKLESLGVLAGGIAHDFNNLLTGILGHAALALQQTPSDEALREHLVRIETAAVRAADLTNQMLAYAGRGRLQARRFDLSELTSEMVRLIETVISKKATLQLVLAPDLPEIQGDPGQIRQVVMNLLTNASDALDGAPGAIHVETGTRILSAEHLARTWLHDALPGGRYVYLEVRDTGRGMDANTRARIFDPFFTTKFTGRGLGLAAALGIVRAHRGAIEVTSELGGGSTFRVMLPAVAALAARAEKAPLEDRLWRGEGTVLVVDDDETARAVAAAMLRRLGFDVLLAADGREGLSVFAENASRIDLVLLDLTMPAMSGEEVFSELRRIRPAVRCVLTSGYSESDIAERFGDRGFVGFLPKPYRPESLAARIRDALA